MRAVRVLIASQYASDMTLRDEIRTIRESAVLLSEVNSRGDVPPGVIDLIVPIWLAIDLLAERIDAG